MPLGSVSFLSGGSWMADANEEDVVWVERIATAFEQAGSGGTLTNRALDLRAVAASPTAWPASQSTTPRGCRATPTRR